ncbi:MAG TPA: hypothetical protein V6D08_02205 [Candidatus Obscuribacterales bacterium]
MKLSRLPLSSWLLFGLVFIPAFCVAHFIAGWFVFGCNPDDYGFPSFVPRQAAYFMVLATALSCGVAAGLLVVGATALVGHYLRLSRRKLTSGPSLRSRD